MFTLDKIKLLRAQTKRSIERHYRGRAALQRKRQRAVGQGRSAAATARPAAQPSLRESALLIPRIIVFAFIPMAAQSRPS